MSVTLGKGANVSLSKEAPGLSAIVVGLGWQARSSTGAEFDLDASALLIGANDKVPSDAHFIFYNNLLSPDGSVEHTGDDLTGGSGFEDDEQIKVNLAEVPRDIERIVVAVSIHDAHGRDQNFGQVRRAFIRVVNQADERELTRYDLSEDASTETAMIFGELYRMRGEWKFRAVGQGYVSGLAGIATDFGVDIA
ncbi:MAG: TerD family protein [Jatrophihabitans sp.]